MTKGEETGLVIVVVAIVAVAIIYFVLKDSPSAKPPATKSNSGLGDAACTAALAAFGVPSTPGLCSAVAPFAGDIVQAGGKFGVQTVKDVLAVGSTATGTASDVASSAIKAGGGVVKDTIPYFASGASAYLKYGTGVGQAAFAYKTGEKVVTGAYDAAKSVGTGIVDTGKKVVNGAGSFIRSIF